MTHRQQMLLASSFAIAFLLGGTSARAGDAAAGEAAYKAKCAGCHTIDEGGKNGVGPNLFGIVGKKSGQVAGFTKYTAEFKAIEVTWNDEKLKEWSTTPTKMVPKTKMLLLKKVSPEEADNIIAFMHTKK